MEVAELVLTKLTPGYDGPNVTLRETPAHETRDRWHRLEPIWETSNWERKMNVIEPKAQPFTQSTIERFLDGIAAWFCHSFHPADKLHIDYVKQHQLCTTCGKKFALPWADQSKLAADVFVFSE